MNAPLNLTKIDKTITKEVKTVTEAHIDGLPPLGTKVTATLGRNTIFGKICEQANINGKLGIVDLELDEAGA